MTRNGRRATVLLGADDYDALMETLNILSDRALTEEVREAEADLAEGHSRSNDEVKAGMARERRAT
ncbi:MAG: type II toxin-antitoxin system prevent-host-death family antitoxin [Brachybacterium sp.]|nr:type II toxin-antitoxin system prevent-host-death family antitoxin [Brachybacterium sp.]